jgi:hypothetical protein
VLASQALRVDLATDAVGLGVLDGGRRAGRADAQRLGNPEQLLAREAELLRELVDADLLLNQNIPLNREPAVRGHRYLFFHNYNRFRALRDFSQSSDIFLTQFAPQRP